VQSAHDDLAAKKAQWAKELKEAQDQLASERTAVEQEKAALATLRKSLENRISRLAEAAAA